jgi:dienelactone hydrolase
MPTIVVVDHEVPDRLGRLQEAARVAGLSLTAAPAADAGPAIDRAVATGGPVVVIGVGALAGPALDAAAEHGTIAGFVSLDGQLEGRHVELIETWPELPILAVASPDDRGALASAVDTYLASHHARSELLVGAEPDPHEVVAWLAGRMSDHVDVEPVMCISSDGWQIHGTLRTPHRDHLVPGVVLLHTGRSDRAAYSRLERLLSEHGLAVLNIDWRGRGESINLGSYFDLDDATKVAAWRDALAALEHLAGDRRVDPDRLGAVGCVHGAEYAVRAAWRDRRVRALVILTGYRPDEPEEAALLVSGDVDVMYINSTGHTITGSAMRDLCDRAPRGTAHMVEYPGSALGYQLFEIDHALEPRIAGWLADVLS